MNLRAPMEKGTPSRTVPVMASQRPSLSTVSRPNVSRPAISELDSRGRETEEERMFDEVLAFDALTAELFPTPTLTPPTVPDVQSASARSSESTGRQRQHIERRQRGERVKQPAAPQLASPAAQPEPQLAPTEPQPTALEPQREDAQFGDTKRSEQVRRVILVSLLIVTSMMVVSRLWTRTPSAATSQNAAVLTDDLVADVAATQGIQSADGAFVPGVGLVLHVTTTDVARDNIASWWSSVVAPIAPRFESVSPDDRLVATIVVGGSESYARVVVAPLVSLDAASSYRISTATVRNTTANPDTNSSSVANSSAVANSSTATSSTTPAVESVPPTVNPYAPNASEDAVVPGNDRRPFASDAADWKPLSGRWKSVAGEYHQTDPAGVDFITQRTGEAPTTFSVSVTMKPIDGTVMNGGLLLFQSSIGKRNGATVVDLTDNNSYARWGYFDDAGTYTFQGGTKLGTPIDPTVGATLKVSYGEGRATVTIDDRNVGTFVPANTKGSFGLTSSNAAVTFADFTVEPATTP